MVDGLRRHDFLGVFGVSEGLSKRLALLMSFPPPIPLGSPFGDGSGPATIAQEAASSPYR